MSILSQIIAYSPNKIDTETKARAMVQGLQNMADGGQLVAPSVDGSRPGYSGQPVRTNIFKNLDKDFQKYYKENLQKEFGLFDKLKPKKKTQFKTVYYPRYLEVQKEKQKLQKAAKTKSTESFQSLNKKLNVKNSNEFVKKWINKNINKYSVREFNDFKNDLFNNFNTEIKNNSKKYPMRKNTQMFKDNFPVVGDIKGKELISINDINFPRVDTLGRTQEFAYKKLFYQNKLKDPNFKKQVEEYIDWSLTKKTAGGAGSLSKTAALDQAKIARGFNDDVIFFMGEVLNERTLTPGGGEVGIHDIFKKVFPKKGKNYFNKYHNTWANWKNNFDAVAKLAGLDQSQTKALMQKQINDSKKLKSLYNVKNLPLEFVFVQDHLYGLAEAKALGDPKIAAQTLKNLVAATNEQNRILGKEGFSKKRVALMNRFKKSSLENKATIVNQLNTLADEYVPGRLQYNVKKDGSLKITNLQPEKNFKERASAYKDITKTFPKNIQKTMLPKNIQKTMLEFAGTITDKCKVGNADGGRIGFASGSADCLRIAREGLEKGLKNGFKKGNQQVLAEGILKAGRGLRSAFSLSGLFGPLALGFTVAAEAGLVGYDMLSSGKSFREAVGDSVFNYALGDKTKIDSVEERNKRMVEEGMTPEQMSKIAAMESGLEELKTFGNYYKQLDAIQKNRDAISMSPEDTFNKNAFQLDLDKQEDLINKNIQNFYDSGLKEKIQNIDYAGGFQNLSEGLRKNELAQLQSVNNPLEGRLSEEKRSARIRELMLQNPDVRYYMDSYPTNYGFMEGGIASLNVKK